MDVAGFLLILGASARLTRLVTEDEIMRPVRDLAARRGPAWLAFLLGCPWCAGLWLCIGVVAAWHWTPDPWFTLGAVALTANLLYGIAAGLVDSVLAALYGSAERAMQAAPADTGVPRRRARLTNDPGGINV